jgi:hypothetical protein
MQDENLTHCFNGMQVTSNAKRSKTGTSEPRQALAEVCAHGHATRKRGRMWGFIIIYGWCLISASAQVPSCVGVSGKSPPIAH